MKKIRVGISVVVLAVMVFFSFQWYSAEVKLAESESYCRVLEGRESSLVTDLNSIRSQFASLKTSSKIELEKAEATAVATLEKVSREEYERGFEEGKESVLPKIPTYSEFQKLIKGYEAWPLSVNLCTVLSMEARNRFQQKGYKVGVASVFFRGIGGHLIMVFDTSDRGEVFVDLLPCSGENGGNSLTLQEVQVELDKSYTAQNGLGSPGFDDTVWKLTVMW
ncbi:MAG: hypothetical protein ABIB55_02000 [Candidatus Nealsonbacteria bacterium]